MEKLFDFQFFADETETDTTAPETNITATADLEPAISIDMVSRLAENIDELRQLLGIAEIDTLAAGSNVKVYKTAVGNSPEQVAEGEVINLTKVSSKLVKTIELNLKKYRKATTAEAIQKTGRDTAINKTDDALIKAVQKDIRDSFYTELKKGTGKASGDTFQEALANAWAKIQDGFHDTDASPVYFVSAENVAEYLGKASISTQSAFGMTYIEDFLGLGSVVITPKLEKGKLYATAKENLHAAAVNMSSGDVAASFGLTADETGLVGMSHYVANTTAALETLVMAGIVFYPEYIDKVYATTIGENASTGEDASA